MRRLPNYEESLGLAPPNPSSRPARLGLMYKRSEDMKRHSFWLTLMVLATVINLAGIGISIGHTLRARQAVTEALVIIGEAEKAVIQAHAEILRAEARVAVIEVSIDQLYYMKVLDNIDNLTVILKFTNTNKLDDLDFTIQSLQDLETRLEETTVLVPEKRQHTHQSLVGAVKKLRQAFELIKGSGDMDQESRAQFLSLAEGAMADLDEVLKSLQDVCPILDVPPAPETPETTF